ncbi:MAG: barstar family protein [Rhodospirillales bacterium]|nr:barstar family protein [Rhodospirillales bacterium]
MTRVILDFAAIKDEAALHDALAKGLGLPAHYGRNLDALWDCLTRDVKGPVTIDLRNVARADARLARYVALLRKAAAKRDDFTCTSDAV